MKLKLIESHIKKFNIKKDDVTSLSAPFADVLKLDLIPKNILKFNDYYWTFDSLGDADEDGAASYAISPEGELDVFPQEEWCQVRPYLQIDVQVRSGFNCNKGDIINCFGLDWYCCSINDYNNHSRKICSLLCMSSIGESQYSSVPRNGYSNSDLCKFIDDWFNNLPDSRHRFIVKAYKNNKLEDEFESDDIEEVTNIIDNEYIPSGFIVEFTNTMSNKTVKLTSDDFKD